VEYAQKSDKVKEKAKHTCQEKYNCDSYICTLTKEQQSENGKKSWTDLVNKKRETTCLKKYGVKHISKNNDIKEKRKSTILNKYGVEYAQQNHEIQTRSKKRYTYKNITFDSSWELAYYIWLSDNKKQFEYHPNKFFEYSCNNKIHRYFPDFLVENNYIEIKGEQFFKNDEMIYPYHNNNNVYNELINAKYECMKLNSIILIRKNEIRNILYYVQKTYGKDYLKSFKNT